MKKQRGITLIALVITIIVLLILAGISLSITIGENGILSKAKDSKKETEKAQGAELITMAVGGSYGTDGKIDIIGLLNKNLKNIEGLTYNGNPIDENDENKRINSLPAKVKINEYDYKIKGDGTVKGADPNEIEISDILGHETDFYGKYVTNYNSPYDDGIASTTEPGKWQIFLVDEDNIFLIASSYISRNYTKEKIKGENSYGFSWFSTSTSLKAPYHMYFGGIYDAYSQVSDIQNVLSKFDDKTKEKYHYWMSIPANQNNLLNTVKAAASMIDVQLWDGYRNVLYADYAIGGPTLEMFCNSYNLTHDGDDLVPVSEYDRGYRVKKEIVIRL